MHKGPSRINISSEKEDDGGGATTFREQPLEAVPLIQVPPVGTKLASDEIVLDALDVRVYPFLSRWPHLS